MQIKIIIIIICRSAKVGGGDFGGHGGWVESPIDFEKICILVDRICYYYVQVTSMKGGGCLLLNWSNYIV